MLTLSLLKLSKGGKACIASWAYDKTGVLELVPHVSQQNKSGHWLVDIHNCIQSTCTSNTRVVINFIRKFTAPSQMVCFPPFLDSATYFIDDLVIKCMFVDAIMND